MSEAASLSTLPYESDLGEKSYLTVVLRLLLDEDGALVHGEVADLQGTPRERFADWDGMIRAVQSCIADNEHGSQ